MNFQPEMQHSKLDEIAHEVMIQRGLLPDFSDRAKAELEKINTPANPDEFPTVRDLRNLLWSSIDNDDSLDLDQLTVAEELPENEIKIWVAVADVDALVKAGSAIDEHAKHNTTSVYTASRIFPMLPEKLSTGLTSLNFDQDRLAIIAEMVIPPSGEIKATNLYRGLVRNHAKLAYDSTAAWLEGNNEVPQAIAEVNGLAENIRLQDIAAQRMKEYRHRQGALSLETIEAKAVFDGNAIKSIEREEKNRAKEIVENFMIATNGITARFLSAKNFPSIRRVVRVPKRWEKIVELAAEFNFDLPQNPDAVALEKFLKERQVHSPLQFPDISLSVIKLLGAGEYVAEMPGDRAPGHFGLAVKDYSHSTAPNRRYTDLITQRLIKAALNGESVPYSFDELRAMARHFTLQEDAANKVERQVGKSAAALFLRNRIGEQFEALVTGASDKGTWARLLKLPIEGKVEKGYAGLDVGDRVRVELISTDVERGYIDFKRVK